jgi:hypothetical protein
LQSPLLDQAVDHILSDKADPYTLAQKLFADWRAKT